MPSTRSSRFRFAALGAAVVIAAYVNVTGIFEPDVTTDVGSAGLAVGDDAARSVERVAYRQDVVRVGDVVVADGTPRDPITDSDVAAMWDLVDRVWPDSLSAELRQLSVIEESPRGLVGVVHPASTGGWILSLDLADLDDPQLIEETIIHELSHVATLRPGIFRFGEGSCDGIRIELGCVQDGTVLAEFASTFWPGDDAGDIADDFVNEYATTAAHEDLAETFTAWVLGWPIDSPIVQAKADLLAGDPELAALATDLRVALGN